MRRLVAQHRFSNGARVAVYRAARERGIPDCDKLLLEFRQGDGKTTGMFMRFDEALITIEVLARGVNRAVSAYRPARIARKKTSR